MPDQRPITATIMTLCVLLYCGANATAAINGLVDQSIYQSVGALPLLGLRAAASGIWALLWALLAVGLWRGWRVAPHATIAAFWLYAVFRVGLWAAIATTPYEQGRWPFVIMLNITAALIVTLVHAAHFKEKST